MHVHVCKGSMHVHACKGSMHVHVCGRHYSHYSTKLKAARTSPGYYILKAASYHYMYVQAKSGFYLREVWSVLSVSKLSILKTSNLNGTSPNNFI